MFRLHRVINYRKISEHHGHHIAWINTHGERTHGASCARNTPLKNHVRSTVCSCKTNFLWFIRQNFRNARSWKCNCKNPQEVENLTARQRKNLWIVPKLQEGARSSCKANYQDLFVMPHWWSDCSALARNLLNMLTYFRILMYKPSPGWRLYTAIHQINCFLTKQTVLSTR